MKKNKEENIFDNNDYNTSNNININEITNLKL